MPDMTAHRRGKSWLPMLFPIFIAACSSSSDPAGAELSSTPANSAARGAALYQQNCAPCHREKGEGVPNVYPGLLGSAAVRGDPIELAQWVLSQKRPASIPAGRYPTQMLLFGWMNDQDAAALLTYIRSKFGGSASAVDAAIISRAREEYGNDRHR